MKLLIKKLAQIFLVSLLLFSIVKPASAETEQVNVYFFWGVGCSHCEKEKLFLEKLEAKYPGVQVHDFEVWENRENLKLLVETGKKLEADTSGVPFTVVGEHYFVGWYDEETTGSLIERAVQCVVENGCDDVVSGLRGPRNLNPPTEPLVAGEVSEETKNRLPLEKIKLPIFGEVETKNLSLPVLTIILGGLDGFNPCAMWTLLFLIGLLLGMEDKKRRWVLGTAFIVASSFVYFLFMAAWLNLLLFIGFVTGVKVAIGLVALGGGIYNLREFIVNRNSSCKVTGGEKRQAVFEKLKGITHQKQFWLALGGIIVLAFAVNLVELICSAGLPVVFTQILTLSHLPRWQYYAYMLLYVFIFMLDDLIIFFSAMVTLEMTGMSTKYSRASHLIGGVLMVIIGILMIFKPEILMFG